MSEELPTDRVAGRWQRYRLPILWAVGGTILSGIIAGWVYGNAAGARSEAAESTTPIAFFGMAGVAVALSRSARELRPFVFPVWRLIWVLCAILYPLLLNVTFNGVVSAAQSTVVDNAVATYQRNYEAMYGRTPTADESLAVRTQLQQELDGMQDDPNGSKETTGNIRAQWFWGPIWISLVAASLWKSRGYRLKWRPNLDALVEKVDNEP